MNESLIQKTWLAEERNIDPKTRLSEERNIDPKTRSGGERFVHLPDTSLWIIFHVTCIGSALVARENRNDSFILTGSSDTDLRIFFHVTCRGSEEETERICLPRSLSRG